MPSARIAVKISAYKKFILLRRFMDGIIFDLDGTLLDSMGMWRRAGVIYLEKFGIHADESLADKILPLKIADAARVIGEYYNLPLTPKQIADGVNGVMEEGYNRTIQPKEGAAELLEKLYARGIPMAIATATDSYLVRAALSRLGWEKYFRGLATCTQVGVGKRDGADVYIAAMNLFGGKIPNCWVLEDSPHAALTAKRAGYRVLGVRDEGGKNDQQALIAASTAYVRSLSPARAVLSVIGIE